MPQGFFYQHKRVLSREGLALMVKSSLLQVDRAKGQVESTREALDAASENRELNVRAYQNELAETKEVIEAQLMESFIKGKHLKALYDHATSQAKMNFLIGNQIQKAFN